MKKRTLYLLVILPLAILLLIPAAWYCLGVIVFLDGHVPRHAVPYVTPAEDIAAQMIVTSGHYYGSTFNASSKTLGPRADIYLNQDGTFRVSSVPSSCLPDLTEVKESAIDGEGTWSMGDDGDGSWMITLSFKTINHHSSSYNTAARPGENILLFGPDQWNVHKNLNPPATQAGVESDAKKEP